MQNPTYGSAAERLLALGYEPIPIKPRAKRPIPERWQAPTHESYAAWRYTAPHAGVGLLTRLAPAVDIDSLDPDIAAAWRDIAERVLGPTPLHRTGRAPKTLLLYRGAAPQKKLISRGIVPPGAATAEKVHRIEILGDRQQFVAYGTHPDTLLPYAWRHAQTPLLVPHASLPLAPPEALHELIAAINSHIKRSLIPAGWTYVGEAPSAKRVLHTPPTDYGPAQAAMDDHLRSLMQQVPTEAPNPEEVRSALRSVPADDYELWYAVAGALWCAFGDDGFPIFDEWSQTSIKYDPHAVAQKWRKADSIREYTVASIFHHARQRGWTRAVYRADAIPAPRQLPPKRQPAPPDRAPLAQVHNTPPEILGSLGTSGPSSRPPKRQRPPMQDAHTSPTHCESADQAPSATLATPTHRASGAPPYMEPPEILGSLGPSGTHPEITPPPTDWGSDDHVPPPQRAPRGDAMLVLSPAAPRHAAEEYRDRLHAQDDIPTLYYYFGAWRIYTGSHYAAVDDNSHDAVLHAFLAKAVVAKKNKAGDVEYTDYLVTPQKANAVIDCLKKIANVPQTVALPTWLWDCEHTSLEPSDILPCRNGLLHLPTRTLLEHTPAFFTPWSVSYAYAHDAPPPRHLLAFLDSVWGSDPESIATLQEFCGLYLTHDTSYQKILLIVGPKRSGKGTIFRMLRALLGPENVAVPALSTLGSQFGLGAMIDRPLACIPDAHLSAAADRAIILDRLLSISGEDAVTVERKYMPAWEGKLPTRILMGANEPPRLSDASGALVSRLIILRQTETFLNREDRTLDAQLASELPSILNWALEGLARLRARGRFVAPASSRELTAEVGEMAAPVSTFVADWCATDPQHEVRISMLYYSWRAWCGEHGHDHPGTVQMFSHALRAAYPTLGRTRRRVEGRVEKFFAGIRLLTAEEGGPIDVKSAGKK